MCVVQSQACVNRGSVTTPATTTVTTVTGMIRWSFQPGSLPTGTSNHARYCCSVLSTHWMNCVFVTNFYVRQHICYSVYMLSPVCPSVRLSVTWVDHTKTIEVRIMKFSPYGSPIPLDFVEEVSSRNSKGFPEWGRQTMEGWVKSEVFYL